MATWRELISWEMGRVGDSWYRVEKSTLSEEELDISFYSGYGGEEGLPFTLWTKTRVYFPVCYDGLEWVGSVPRNPCEEKTEHWGGG